MKRSLGCGKVVLRSILGALTLAFAITLPAAPGTLADAPLFTSTFAKPNIFFLVDSSGSMGNIDPAAPFDANTTYFTCPFFMQIDPSNVINMTMDRDGYPYITIGATDTADWGNINPLIKGNTKRFTQCFNNAATYTAGLYDSGTRVSTLTSYPTDTNGISYSGNYLNWYFGSSPQQWGNVTQKPGQLTRLDFARQAVSTWLNSLPNSRVGLGQFDADRGTQILVGTDDIDSNRAALISALNGITTVGGSPIAGALRDVGRYFVASNNNTLTLHPGQINQATAPAFNIFNNQPNYNSGVSKASPIQYYCQGNFLLLLTDGRSTNDTSINSSTGLAGYDGYCATANPACLSYDRRPGQDYAPDDGTGYGPDVSQALFQINLRPDLGKSGSNMLTYVLGFVQPTSVDIPYMQQVAANGGGLYGQANTAVDLLNSLTSATVSILSSMSISAPVTFNSNLLSPSTDIFWVQYSALAMTGDLIKADINSDGSIGTVNWKFSDILNKTSFSNRLLWTYNKDTLTAVPFTPLSGLSVAQKADLNMGPTGTADGLGQSRIDYLSGDRSLEIKNFRVRASVLGDIVDSGPVFVGPPNSAWPDTTPFPTTAGNLYSDFVKAQQTRQGMVYIGANDGMLHAVNADTGREVMGYIPANVFSSAAQQGLHYLTDPAYQHRFYVDLTPAVADAYISARHGGTQWRTVLVGGERKGGKGYYALDITNPANFSSGQQDNVLLWEFTDSDDVNLGYTYTKPVIALMNNGRWAAIFGNGYNNTGLGKASLFIVYLDGDGLKGTWKLGTDYIRIDVGSGTTSSTDGLSDVAVVDVNGDGVADRIYAGSVRTGQLWAFDVSSTDATQWKNAYGSNPFFSTAGTVSTPMPITSAPIVVTHPTIANSATNSPNVMVYFGTGQYLTASDPANTDGQALYGVWDRGDGNLTTSNLVQQTLTTTGTARTASNNAVNFVDSVSSPHGWFINLSGGERDIASPRLGSNLVLFTTVIPNVGSECSSGGSGWVIAVSQDKGGTPSNPFFDVNGDSTISASDNAGNKVVSGIYYSAGFPSQPSFLQAYMYVPLSNATVVKMLVNIPSSSGGRRLSWQELTN